MVREVHIRHSRYYKKRKTLGRLQFHYSLLLGSMLGNLCALAEVSRWESIYCESSEHPKRVNAYTPGVDDIHASLPFASMGYLGGAD